MLLPPPPTPHTRSSHFFCSFRPLLLLFLLPGMLPSKTYQSVSVSSYSRFHAYHCLISPPRHQFHWVLLTEAQVLLSEKTLKWEQSPLLPPALSSTRPFSEASVSAVCQQTGVFVMSRTRPLVSCFFPLFMLFPLPRILFHLISYKRKAVAIFDDPIEMPL